VDTTAISTHCRGHHRRTRNPAGVAADSCYATQLISWRSSISSKDAISFERALKERLEESWLEIGPTTTQLLRFGDRAPLSCKLD
jgi:hypothetical protein